MPPWQSLIPGTDSVSWKFMCMICFFYLGDACVYGNINCLNGGVCSSDPNTGVFLTCEPCPTGFSGIFCQNGESEMQKMKSITLHPSLSCKSIYL